MGIIAWVVFGLIAGIIAKVIMPGKDPGGFILTVIIGIAGALIGGYISTLFGFGDITGFDIRSFIIAVLGALLLLFIYLELGAMVGIYFKTNHMPVRFLIYVAITALTRHLLGYVNAQHKPEIDLLITAGAIFILAASVLVLRYASFWFPSERAEVPETRPARSD